MEDTDMTPDLNTTEGRNRALDQDLLKSGEEIAGIPLRPITAGDLALLIEVGVGLVIGRTDSIAYDVGAILSRANPRPRSGSWPRVRGFSVEPCTISSTATNRESSRRLLRRSSSLWTA